MAKPPIAAVVFLVLLPVGVGTGILGTYTLGESLSSRDPAPLGIGLALLTVALTGWFLFFSEPRHRGEVRFGSVLAVCGTLCILVALCLQFYLASLIADNSRRVTDILREKGGNVNLNVNFPDTIKAISYLALFAGIWLAALGIRMAVGREGENQTRALDQPPPRRLPEPTETGFRVD